MRILPSTAWLLVAFVPQTPVIPQPQPSCGDMVAFQVLLDRAGFSPGQIDGKFGTNASHALSAFQQTRKLTSTGQPNCDSWHALGGDTSGPTIVTYAVTPEDLKGPFTSSIPLDLVAQGSLPELGYTSALEALAERFHVSPLLLQHMNGRVPLAPGKEIQVPAVMPFDPNAKPSPDPSADDVTITVSRDESSLRATHTDGSLIFFAPVTTGSARDPLPLGTWKVTGIDWRPVFHYDPALFWNAKRTDSKTAIKAGPNNPVGIAWIDLNLPHYGLHGTPEPRNIAHTESHGCVRLTNWDVARVVTLVRVGTQVVFQ